MIPSQICWPCWLQVTKRVSCTHLSPWEERASAAVRLRPSSDIILAWTGNPLMGSRQQERTVRMSSYLHNMGFRDDNFILEARKGGEEQQDRDHSVKRSINEKNTRIIVWGVFFSMHLSNEHTGCQLKMAPSEIHEMDLCWNKKQKSTALSSLIVSALHEASSELNAGLKDFQIGGDLRCYSLG